MSTRTVAATGPSASSIDDVPPLVDRTGSVSREAAPPTETATAVASTSSSNKRARVSLSPPPKPTPATPRTKKVRKGVVDELARELMALIDDKPRKETYNKGKQFIDDAIRKYPWVTRGQIYGRRETIKEKERRDKARTLTKLAAVAATTRISSSDDMTNSYATQARETSASSARTSPATSSTETGDASNDSEDDGIAENVRWLYELSSDLCEKIESEQTAMTVAINVYDCLEEIDEDDEEKFTSKVSNALFRRTIEWFPSRRRTVEVFDFIMKVEERAFQIKTDYEVTRTALANASIALENFAMAIYHQLLSNALLMGSCCASQLCYKAGS